MLAAPVAPLGVLGLLLPPGPDDGVFVLENTNQKQKTLKVSKATQASARFTRCIPAKVDSPYNAPAL
jgi:hypothetical protein